MAKERLFLGLASGWAADGVDAAIVAVSGRGQRMKVKELHSAHVAFSEQLAEQIRAAAEDPAAKVSQLLELDGPIARALAEAASGVLTESKVPHDRVVAIGSSGQIIARAAKPDGSEHCLIEIGSPAVIAGVTNISVASGFAASDIAAGGLGGPVTAWPDWLLFRDRRLSRVVVHLGGVVSLSFVPAAAVCTDVVAFDVCPGSIVLDAMVREHFGRPFDRDGGIAADGKVCPELLNELLACAFAKRSPPKVTRASDWGAVYRERLATMARKHGVSSPADLIATFTETIARCLAGAVGQMTERPHEVVLAGGASQNIHLAQRIRMLLSPCSTYAVERYGFAARSYSAVCCATLAAARVDGHPAHCPSATGARAPAILGALWTPAKR